jgi:hypothetical protein
MPSTSNVTLCNDIRTTDRFEQISCWRGEDTREILDVEATRSSDAVFLATHHPVPMRRFEDHDAPGADRPYSQEQFLEDFLDPEESYRFVPILGTTGVGKSHLVRWLDVKIRERTSDAEKRRVLLIEKAGATLREVLRRILALDVAEGEQFDEYREKLEEAGENLSEDELKERIRFELKVAVENYDPFEKVDEDQEEGEDGDNVVSTDHQNYVAKILPPFIDDPYFRDDWLEEGGVIDETYRTSFQEGGNQESPSFSEETLPLDESLTDVQKKAPSSLNAYQKLTGNPKHLDAALHVLDECLGTAVRRVLNFKGNDLFELMNEVRREFARRDIELILLIEDIAAVQGLDRQLLASVERSDEEFGVLRTAMGCTEGHYQEKIMKTTKDRASFHLNLNVEDREAANVDLATFASRYLNAIRLGEEQLDAIIAEDERVPSACTACPFQKKCHEAFGERENRGLYPFTEEALHTLYQGVTDEPFNPRKLIMRVLRYVLVTYTDDLKKGTFPPEGLKQQFRRNADLNVDPVTKQKWRRDDPDHADQRILLADTWGRFEDGEDLSAEVFRAFGIDIEDAEGHGDGEEDPKDKDGDESTDDETEVTESDGPETGDDQISGDGAPPPPEPRKTEAERRLQKKEEQLGKWTNETPLPQSTVQDLRGLVHSSVVSRIDWDAEDLSQKFFSNRTRTEFCNTSIDFNGGEMQQDVQSKGRRIRLRLPLDGQTPDDVQIALVGLLRAQHHGDWRFEKGRDYLLKASDCLDVWVEHILDQLRRPSRDRPQWDPAPVAAELLAVRARLGGADLRPKIPLRDRVDALFRSYEFDTDGRGRAWTRLVDGLEKAMRHEDDQNGLVEILEAHAWLRKGERAHTRVYDLARFESVLSSLDEHSSLQARFNATSKEELRKSYDPLWEAREHVEKYLQRAVEDEVSTLQSWKTTVEHSFEITENLASQVDCVDDALFSLMNVDQRGVLQNREMRQYESLSESMREEETQKTVEEVDDCLAAWKESDVPGPVLTRLAADRDRRLNIVSSYVELADTLLNKAHEGLQSDVDMIESGEGGLTETYDHIRSDLDDLAEALTAIRETDGEATG